MKIRKLIVLMLTLTLAFSSVYADDTDGLLLSFDSSSGKISVTKYTDYKGGTDVSVIMLRPHYDAEDISADNVNKAVLFIKQGKITEYDDERNSCIVEYVLPSDSPSGYYKVLVRVGAEPHVSAAGFRFSNALRKAKAEQRIMNGEDIKSILDEYCEDISEDYGSIYYDMSEAEKNCVAIRINDRNNFLQQLEKEIKRIALIKEFKSDINENSADKIKANSDTLDINADVLEKFRNLSSSKEETVLVLLNKKLLDFADPNEIDFSKLLSDAIDESEKNGDGGGSGGGGGGGGGSRGGSQISAGGSFIAKDDTPVKLPETPNSQGKGAVFSDIANVEWAKVAIELLYEKGVINGNGQGEFCPNDEITREEFGKILCTVFELGASTDIEIPFVDVNKEDWFYPFVCSAYASKSVTGISETEFGVGLPITREDMATMVYRMMGEENVNAFIQYDVRGTKNTEFKDDKEISGYAYEAVTKLARAGYVSGMGDSMFMPKNTATRAEAAQFIYNIFYK